MNIGIPVWLLNCIVTSGFSVSLFWSYHSTNLRTNQRKLLEIATRIIHVWYCEWQRPFLAIGYQKCDRALISSALPFKAIRVFLLFVKLKLQTFITVDLKYPYRKEKDLVRKNCFY